MLEYEDHYIFKMYIENMSYFLFTSLYLTRIWNIYILNLEPMFTMWTLKINAQY
jgi:glucose-6-phosphate 1-dehydrogenase